MAEVRKNELCFIFCGFSFLFMVTSLLRPLKKRWLPRCGAKSLAFSAAPHDGENHVPNGTRPVFIY
jgi:hypothetical protein